MIEECYLGDGVYAKVENGMVKLSTIRDDGEHFIYLEPAVMAMLEQFFKQAVEGGAIV